MGYCEILTWKNLSNGARYITVDINIKSDPFNGCPTEYLNAILESSIFANNDQADDYKKNGRRFLMIDSSFVDRVATRGNSDIIQYEMGTTDLPEGTKFPFTRSVSAVSNDEETYTVKMVDRNNVLKWNAGSVVYQLVDDSDTIYTMQSYSQRIDSTMDEDKLKTMQLNLPDGWTYRYGTLVEDMYYEALPTAYVIQDEYENSYSTVGTNENFVDLSSTSTEDDGITAVNNDKQAAATHSAYPDLTESSGKRGMGYCEILTWKNLSNGARYITVDINIKSDPFNGCPTEYLNAILESSIFANNDQADDYKKNGRRFLMIDSSFVDRVATRGNSDIIQYEMGTTDLPEGTKFPFTRSVSAVSNDEETYTVKMVDRNNVLKWNAGSVVYQLVDDSDTIYTMQSYSQRIDSTMDEDKLKTMQLNLPDGWTYRYGTLVEDMYYEALPTAYVIQDEYENSYSTVGTNENFVDLSSTSTEDAEDIVADRAEFVAIRDSCRGTRTNPIPNGEQWIEKGAGKKNGCGMFGLSACARCVPNPNGERIVCATDKCKGTLTNPLPNGEQWIENGKLLDRSCCSYFAEGTCQSCLPPRDTGNGVKCADENGQCSCNGQVRYGMNGVFTSWREVTGSIGCNNGVFGDPLYGTVKACYCRGAKVSLAEDVVMDEGPSTAIVMLGVIGACAIVCQIVQRARKCAHAEEWTPIIEEI